MAKFNFIDISLSTRADITDVRDNFDKVEALGLTEASLTEHITDAMPHIATDSSGIRYRYGFKPATVNGSLTVAFIFEAV